MYELLIKIMYEQDYRKYSIQELREMKAILNQFNKQVLEVKLKRIKEQEYEGETTEDNPTLRIEPSTEEVRRRGLWITRSNNQRRWQRTHSRGISRRMRITDANNKLFKNRRTKHRQNNGNEDRQTDRKDKKWKTQLSG